MQQENKVVYKFRGVEYLIKDDLRSSEALFLDFKHCEKIGDITTIENRIFGGLKTGWLVKI